MLPFVELHTYARAFFMMLLFVTVCLSVCLFLLGCLQKRVLPKITASLAGIISLIFLLPFSTYIWAEKNNAEPAEKFYLSGFLGMSALTVAVVSVFVCLTVLFMSLYYYRKIRKGISAFSVKEGVDKLATGICFSNKSGMIKLINHKMDELHRVITGKEMSNAVEFIEVLRNGVLCPGVERLAVKENIIIGLPDYSVWSFSVKDIGAMYEITAANTTDLYRASEELRKNNAELQKMNDRMRRYGENVDELTKARERLETKHRIHADLGNALFATRLFLQDNDGDSGEIVRIWKRNIAVLGVEKENSIGYDELKGLFKAARAVGIDVEMSGEIPSKEKVRRFFLDVTAEALTNAVRHADAKKFRVAFSSDIFCYSAVFSNNGKKPSEEISMGGGLSSIKRKTQEMGGRMKIETVPEFSLSITIPR